MNEPTANTKNNKTGVLGALIGVAAAVPNLTAAAAFSLLGLAGGTAASVAGWLSPVFIGLSAALLGRAHYVLYVLKRGSRMSTVITWLATVFVIGYWTWQWGR